MVGRRRAQRLLMTSSLAAAAWLLRGPLAARAALTTLAMPSWSAPMALLPIPLAATARLRRGRFAALRTLATLLPLSALMTLLPMPAPAAPKVEDTMAQRLLACTGCHGAQGRAASDGYYPRIAGKPAGYLYNQLLAFRNGTRHYALMTNLLAPLDDTYLGEIAAHFASLDLPYPPPQPATGADAAALARGEALVQHGDPARRLPACVQCHGVALMGVAPAIPALLGMPRDYLNAQLGAWRTGARQATAPDCMAEVARRLGPDDIAALSHWLAAQPVAPDARPALALPAPLPLDCGGLPGRTRQGSATR